MSSMLDIETIKQFSTEIAKADFGAENVVRVESEPTEDFYGKEALDILIVIAPGVAEVFTGDDVLDTLVQISDRLQRAGDERFPIISYATEEELADIDSPQPATSFPASNKARGVAIERSTPAGGS